MRKLSRKDLKALKKILNLAVVDEKARAALSEGKLPDGKWGLSESALDALHSITSAEFDAFASIYQKMRTRGAKKSDLKDAIIL